MATAVSAASVHLDPRLLSWLSWAKGSNFTSVIVFQFLPNILTFFTMYIYIPKGLSHLSSFEYHITVSGEQRTILVKMVYFFLLNFFLFKATVETALESALLNLSKCYSHPNDCPGLESLLSTTFIGSSSLSVLAFLITSSLFGVSLDLLSPVWMIRRRMGSLRSRIAALLLDSSAEEVPPAALEEIGLLERVGSFDFSQGILDNVIDLPISPRQHRDVLPKPPDFDFPQYLAYNLTAFAMTLFYSSAAPLVLPACSFFFWYRYCVDKYNFLFIYRSSSTPKSSDGRLLGTVLKFMRTLLCCHLGCHAVFFAIRGDNEKLQCIMAGIALVLVIGSYGFEKLFGLPQEKGLDGLFIQNLGTVEQFLSEQGQTGYETLSRTL